MLVSDYIDGDGIGVQLYKVLSTRDGVMKKKVYGSISVSKRFKPKVDEFDNFENEKQ